ncbi:SDR family NAD(P)-dependent oxidoreductase [Clostridium algidicarnis]|uniref:SDR family NAD(P)-dependent oxidoreductase n=1 Tax=Clostridium algidicarnis TaxID=37659 RepID=UPI001627EB58|nr:SDR family NAD(P)-dependent oxidoreductase [Clostridium algidicarnis]MBB6697127.1 SDR family NAD(P)-dependent oxidoreductase [Clostridium algidicarnis]
MQEEYLENCKELCNKYIAGEKIDFEKLYEGEPVKKVRIPVYPLERKKVKFAEHIMKDAEKAKKCPKKSELHPLINECLVKTYQENIYLTRFNINKQWVIQEHKINMSYVLPGTAYLEMARVVGSRFLNQDEIELRDFKFLSALIVEEDEDVEVQTIVKKEDDHLSILIVSREGDSEDYVDEEWSVHVEGKIYPAKDEAKKMNIDALKKKFARNEQHTRLSDISLDFYNLGPRWDNLYATSVDGEESLITLELPEEFSKDTDIFKVHPSMIDNAMNGLMGYIIKESGGHLYIPLEYESIKLYKPLPKKLYSYMHNFKNFKKDSEKITYDVIIMDEDGQVVAEAVNYNIKKVKSATAMLNRKKKKNSVYYYLGWIKESIKNNNKLNEKHDVVLIKDENGIGNELRENFEKQGFNVYEAEIGKEFVQEDSNRFKIENTKESYLKLLRTIGTDKEIKIVHLASIIGSSSCSELEESEKRIEKGVMSIFRLSQAFMELNINGETILISNSATAVTEKEEYIHAEGNALFGLGKTIREEYQKMKIRCIDIDEKTSSETLLNEILNNENLYQVAYRDDRYVQELRTMDIRRVKDNEVEMKSEGIYVLTGGLGGIGTEIAKYLASKNKVNIALINRTELPNREKWNDILLDNEDKRLCTKINRVLDIEMLGANVEVIKGDIKNYNDIDLIIKNLKEKYGKINGIVHAAGIAGEGLLDMKSEESFRDVIDPKIRGTKVIDTLTRHENLDFFIMFSSIATLSGGLGIGDYTAANSFLDAYLFNSRKTGVMKTINWPFWSETGMAVDGDFLGNSDGSAFHEISNAEAIDAFESFISKDINFSYVGKLNYKGILFRDYDNLPFKVSLNISSRLQSSKENTHVTLVGRNGDFTETEHVIAIMWGAIFGIDEIEVDDNFYELGGNSLISIKLENEIEKKFNILINENNMIETYDTIEKLASYVDSKGGKVSA